MAQAERPAPGGAGSRLALGAAAAAAPAFVLCWAFESPWLGPALIAALALLATFFQTHPRLKVFTFTFWVFTMAAAALFYPAAFDRWGSFRLSRLNVPLIQIIMFGMGASLSVADFARALKMPKAALIGVVLQFTVMPLLGWSLATGLGFAPEVAAGIVLIGSCSGGVASNVMVFLARGNVALSVTMTAFSTLLAPVMTPLAMKLLAGRLIEINFWTMMLSIINMVIIPIGGGLIANKILERKRPLGRFLKLVTPLTLLIAGGSAAVTAAGRWLAGRPALEGLAAQALTLAAVVMGVGWLFNALLAGHRQAFDKILPVVSMASICFIIAIIVAGSRRELLAMGLLLLAAALIHNLAGYALGYLLAGWAGLGENDRRTVAFEVGMQNGGMGVGLALDVLHSSAAALGPAVFGTWMNVTGSTLASWWRDRPPPETAVAAGSAPAAA